MKYLYHKAALGGTFDHLHLGHQSLLYLAFQKADQVVIGVTTDDFIIEKGFLSSLQNYETRKTQLISWLKQKKLFHRAQIIALKNMYGPTLTDKKIDCLVVSQETFAGGVKINEARQKENLDPLPILKCSLVIAQDGKEISSTRIRQGLINSRGKNYLSLLQADFLLNKRQRLLCKEIFGELITEENIEKELEDLDKTEALKMVIGDQTTLVMQKAKAPIDIFIIDQKIQNQQTQETLPSLPVPYLQTENTPGYVNQSLSNTISQAIETKQSVLVTGEEDLAVIPAMLLLPLGSIIFYGQPNQGLVKLVVTVERKEWVVGLLRG